MVIGKAGLSLIAFCAIAGAGIALPIHRRPKEQTKVKGKNNSKSKPPGEAATGLGLHVLDLSKLPENSSVTDCEAIGAQTSDSA